MLRTLANSACLTLALTALACEDQQSTDDSQPEELLITSSKTRELAPSVPEADLTALVTGENAFAVELYQLAGATPGDLFISPLSISQALAMTYAGAAGETRDQMAATLHFTLPDERLHAAHNALDLALKSRGDLVVSEEEGGGQALKLKIANALFGQDGYGFLESFLDTLAVNYGAGMRLVDFTVPEPARALINQWVSDNTEAKIPELLKQGDVTDQTRLVLVNTLYFLASWAHPFDEARTAPGSFALTDGTTIEHAFMNLGESFEAAVTDDYTAISLPYAGRTLSMVVVIPTGPLADFEAALSAESLASLLGGLRERPVTLSLPKFEARSHLKLKDTLEALGMPIAFSEADADFSGMDGQNGLYIGDVIHEAWVKVDEAGTEAAAATAVVMFGRGEPEEPITVKADRPFMFLIRDHETGAILFMGRITDPR